MKYFFIVLLSITISKAQTPFPYTTANAHSHNDYEQKFPFESAYNARFGSIEADVYAINDTLYVAHDRKDIDKSRTLSKLYFEPIAKLLKANDGLIYKGSKQELQLLIDLKTSGEITIPVLEKELRKFPSLIAPNSPIKIVLSGSTPSPEEFSKFPDFILFDGRTGVDYTSEQLKKVGLISQAFYKYSVWNGKGVLTDQDKAKVQKVISEVHQKGKKIRLWATPDHVNTWKMLMNLGLDYINTDHVEELGKYLDGRKGAEYLNPNPHELYKPIYRNNDKLGKVKNVILLIGDGMGLAQIHAGLTANHGNLNLMQFMNIGFSKTAASDSYITDSAAGGTAMATGHKTRNRAIGVDNNFVAVPNIPEKLKIKNIKSAIISAGDIIDATPASFYAHQPYRDYAKQISHDYLKSPVEILIGGGYQLFKMEGVIDSLKMLGINTTSNWADLNTIKPPFVLLKDKVVSMEKGRGDFLKAAFLRSIELLKYEKKGFFMMAEGAQIDSGGHLNKVAYLTSEMLDFDQLIGEAMKFADANGETLVIVTADHETGGLTLLDGNYKNGYVDGQFSTNDHTAIMVPVFAYGPHSLDFRGVYENTEIFHKILRIFNAK